MEPQIPLSPFLLLKQEKQSRSKRFKQQTEISISVFGILHGFGLMIGIGGATHYAILKNSGEGGEANSKFSLSLFAVFSGALIHINSYFP